MSPVIWMFVWQSTHKMPPRTPKTPSKTPSKVSQIVEWKTCTQCQSTFHPKDRHETTCPSVVSHEFSSAEHGLIYEKQLYATVQESACKECPQFLMKIDKTHIVLVSPSAMQLCQVQIGSHVLVETCESPPMAWVFVAWPCLHLHPTSIYIENEGDCLLRMQFCPQLISIHSPLQFLRHCLVTKP